MTRVYYREAVGAFVVFDVTRPATFEAVAKWKKDIDKKVRLATCRWGTQLLKNVLVGIFAGW